MPRRSKGTRLWLRPERRNRSTGRITHPATWVILDRSRHISTGCLAHETTAAQAKFAAYVAENHRPQNRERDIERIDIADVLSLYADARAGQVSRDDELFARLERLNNFWGNRKLAEVNGDTCRAYVAARESVSSARRDLEDLRAAINLHTREGRHRGKVHVVLPAKQTARTRWLTRSEVASLAWAAWRARETQTVHRGSRLNELVATERRPLQHIARFVLMAVYTGTRSGAITSASISRGIGRSFVDLERGIYYRLAEGQRETKKRQPPVPLPPRLLAHLRRWAAKGIIRDAVIEWNGAPVGSVKTGFASAVRLAGLGDDVTPHTLRHTAATWLMQAAVDKWEAAGFLGMSVEMLDRVYGHHHPEHLKTAAQAIGYRRRTSIVGKSLAEPKLPKLKST